MRVRGISKSRAALIIFVVLAALIVAYILLQGQRVLSTQPAKTEGATVKPTSGFVSEYSSKNFLIYVLNANAITIYNYGENITLRVPVHRAVVINTVAEQILIDIGAGRVMVGVEDYADKLPWLFGNYTELPAVSSGMWSVNYELIARLRPDLVITWSYILPQVRQRLRDLGVPVIGWGPNDNLTSLIYALGLATGRTEEAVELIKWIKAVDAELQSSAPQHRPSAYIVFDWEYSPWFTAGNGTDPYAVALLAGLRPCFNQSRQVQPEAVLQCDPEVVLVTTWSLNPTLPNASEYCRSIIDAVKANPVLNRTRAVREGRIIVIPGYLTEGPSKYAAALYIVQTLWHTPGLNATEILDEYFAKFLTTARAGGTWWCNG